MKRQHKLPEWNRDQVWQKVETRLHKKRKRRLLFWWFLGNASILFLIGFLFWTNFRSTDNPTFSDTITSVEKRTSEDKELSEARMLNQASTTNTIINKKPQEGSNTAQQSKNKKGKHLLTQAKKYPLQVDPLIKEAFDFSVTNEIIHTSIRNQQEELVLYTQARALFSSLPIPYSSLQPISYIESTVLAESKRKKKAKVKSSKKRRSKKRKSKKSYAQKKKQQHEEEKHWGSNIWLETGLNFGKRTDYFEGIPTAERLVSEKFRFIQTNAIGIKKIYENNLSLKLGMAYQVIYEKYSYNSSTTTIGKINSEEGTVYNLANGQQYFGSGLLTQERTFTRSIIHNNLLHRLSFPIEAGYYFKYKKVELCPFIGIRTRIFQQFDGIVKINDNHFFDKGKINETYYPNNFDLGLLTSLHLSYPLNEKTRLWLKLNYEQDDLLRLNEAFNRSTYKTVGVHLGYFHRF